MTPSTRPSIRRNPWLWLALLGLSGCSAERIPLGPTGPDHVPLRMAFLSERPPGPPFSTDVYFYDLRQDGPAYAAPNVNTAGIEGPCALSADGRTMAFYAGSSPLANGPAVLLYDVARGEIRIPTRINQLAFVQNPALSGDGRFLAVHYQLGGPFDLSVGVEDLAGDSLLAVPHLNDPNSTNFDPSLNGDGSLIAFASNRLGGRGAFDIYLYSVPGDSLIPLPGLNSSAQDLGPSISGDGRYIAFQSGRGGGAGLIDVYVYDRATQSLVPLPGANTALGEVEPAISPDGRYLAFATEFTGGRDVRVYDIRARRLLRLEGLNDPTYFDEFPALAGP
jgi:Tol biopolymer transport system component